MTDIPHPSFSETVQQWGATPAGAIKQLELQRISAVAGSIESETDLVVASGAAAQTLTLPRALSTIRKLWYITRQNAAGAVVVQPTGNDEIDLAGLSQISLDSNGASVVLVNISINDVDGAWLVIATRGTVVIS
jgi:hypothetical protein